MNLGLRYELDTPATETSDGWANFDATTTTVLIKKSPAGETADHASISASMKTVLERRLSSIANIEAQLLHMAGIAIGATCLSKAIELTTRADLEDDVEPWFESSTTQAGSFFVDVFTQLSGTTPFLSRGVSAG